MVEPADSPMAGWLASTGRGMPQENGMAVVVPISVTVETLGSVDGVAEKAGSLLVCRAYAAAYCTVLAEEAGVATGIRMLVDESHRMSVMGDESWQGRRAPTVAQPRSLAAETAAAE